MNFVLFLTLNFLDLLILEYTEELQKSKYSNTINFHRRRVETLLLYVSKHLNWFLNIPYGKIKFHIVLKRNSFHVKELIWKLYVTFFYLKIHLKTNRLGLVIAIKCNDRREHHAYLIMQYQDDFFINVSNKE